MVFNLIKTSNSNKEESNVVSGRIYSNKIPGVYAISSGINTNNINLINVMK